MKPEEELKELRAREARVRQNVLKVAAEVRPVLAEDLNQFPSREVRKRFVADPGFAATLDDATIAAIKTDLARRGAEVRDRVLAALEQPEPWLAGVACEGPGKSLAENPTLWALTAEAAAVVRAALIEHRFPGAADADLEYRMPTWFIGGKFLPGLAEKYWAAIAELRELHERIAEVEQGRLRDGLAKRWDKS